jgi:hypothetical protein
MESEVPARQVVHLESHLSSELRAPLEHECLHMVEVAALYQPAAPVVQAAAAAVGVVSANRLVEEQHEALPGVAQEVAPTQEEKAPGSGADQAQIAT